MSYFVKTCAKCKTLNHPSMSYCAKCGADLPVIKQESDVKPMDPPAYAVMEAEQNAQMRIDRESLGIKPEPPTQCAIVDIDIPFISMIGFMVKWAIAAIPALIILFILGVFAVAVLAAFGVSSSNH